jgi:hypothetical protein
MGHYRGRLDEFVTPTHMWVAGESLRRVGLRPGMRFLDVVAGISVAANVLAIVILAYVLLALLLGVIASLF